MKRQTSLAMCALFFILLCLSGCAKDNKINNTLKNLKNKIFKVKRYKKPIQTTVRYELYMPAIKKNFAEAPIKFK